MFFEFHSPGKFFKTLNATFIGLIPKKSGAKDTRDYCSSAWLGVCISLFLRFLPSD